MSDLLHGILIVVFYLILAASTAFICRVLFTIPDEIFRKTLHFILLASYIPFVFAFENWQNSAMAAVALEIIIYPILACAERLKRYSSFLTERKGGEFKQSLLLAFTMLAVCVCVCWGWLGDRYLVLACMYAWGVGDAFAALCGKAFGRHKIVLAHTGAVKSVEGSLAMFITSALSVLIILLLRGGLNPAGYILIPLAGSAACTLVELFTPNGLDTITCPTAAMFVILPLTAVFGGFA